MPTVMSGVLLVSVWEPEGGLKGVVKMDVRASRLVRLLGCAITVFCLLAGASAAFAQGGNTANLSGTVADNVGVVPGATVEITNTANGNVRSVPTDAQGVF